MIDGNLKLSPWELKTGEKLRALISEVESVRANLLPITPETIEKLQAIGRDIEAVRATILAPIETMSLVDVGQLKVKLGVKSRKRRDYPNRKRRRVDYG